MAQVPYNAAPATAATDVPTPYIREDATPGSFGGLIGQAAEGVGQKLGQAGSELSQAGLRIQDLNNQRDARDASNLFTADAAQVWGKYSTLEGKAANDALPGFLKQLRDIQQQHAQTLASPIARNDFLNASAYVMNHMSIGASTHAAQQLDVSWSKSLSDNIVAKTQLGVLMQNNAQVVDDAADDIEHSTRQLYTNRQQPQEDADAAVTQELGKYYRTVISAQAATNPGLAQITFDRVKSKMDGNSIEAVEHGLRTVTDDGAVTDFVNEHAAAFASPTPGGRGQPAGATGPSPAAQGAIANTIRQAAAAHGVAADVALTIAQAESRMGQAPDEPGNQHRGVFRLGGQEWQGVGGTDADRGNPLVQAQRGVAFVAKDAAAASAALGRPATGPEVWATHVLGEKGGPALLTADPKASALDVLTPSFGDRASAAVAMIKNGGSPDMTVGRYMDHFRTGYARAASELGASATPNRQKLPVTGIPEPNLVTVKSPGGAGFRVASEAAPQFQGLVNDLEAAGYKINPQTSGGFNDRFIAGTKTPSQHAYGLAVDVNWDKNPRGGAAEEIPADLANKLATKWGLTWGGNWAGASRDPMHFEVAQKAPESAPPQQGGVQLASATGTDTGDHAPPGPAPGGTQPAAASQPQPAAPPSPGTPTHQAGVFGIEYQMVQKAWDDAQKAFPGREDLQRKAVASIWERVQQANILQQKFEGEQAKAQRDAEEKAGQDVVTALSADAARAPGTPPQFDAQKMIWQNPALKWEQKETLAKVADEHLAKMGQPDIAGYGPGYAAVYKGIFAPEGDPNRIDSPYDILKRAAPGGDLTLSGADTLTKVLQMSRRDPDQAAVHQTALSLMTYAKNHLSFEEDTGPVKIRDPKGEAIFNAQFVPKFEAALSSWQKAGKDPWQFLTRDNVDKIMEGMRSPAEMARDRLAATGQAAPGDVEAPGTPIPKAPEGANEGEWSSIMSAPPKAASGQPYTHAAWSAVLQKLMANPEQGVKDFDEKFGKAGLSGQDILKRLQAPERNLSELLLEAF